MSDEIFLSFNGWGVLMLVIFAGSFAISHLLFINKLTRLEANVKKIGFVALILVFVLSGWRAGLISLPIGFICSLVGAALAKALRKEEA